MKFSLTKLFSLILAFALVFALFGCSVTPKNDQSDGSDSSAESSDSTTDTTFTESSIDDSSAPNATLETGKYMLYSIEMGGEVADYDIIVSLGLEGAYIQINSDNSFNIVYPAEDDAINGVYDTASNTMTVDGEAQPYKVDGDFIIIGSDGEYMTFTKGKLPEVNLPTEPDYSADYTIDKYAIIKIKDYGTITVALCDEEAPITVANFIKLAEDGFYDGLTLHRIIKGFMMQGGDPLGNGTGGSDETIKGEFSANGVDNKISHKRGVISMARAGYSYDSASSQFFIMHATSTHLDGQYAAFGWVTDGMDVVDEICTSVKPVDNNGTVLSENQPVIESITIEYKKA